MSSTITFAPAKRRAVSLILGVSGPSGGGKTMSAMMLATGLAGDKRFAVIDTENGRASYYSDMFSFDVAELQSPFSPDRYLDAIQAADAAGYPVIVVDSASHEWAGEGGCLDMQEAEVERMAGNDFAKRERVKLAAWIKPKTAHKRMVTRLLQARAHVILCFRAESKVEIVKKNGKTSIEPKQSFSGVDGWIPISEKSLPFELSLSVLVLPDKPGVPRPIKMMEQHRPFFPLDKPITEEAGKRLGEWAAGDETLPEQSKPAPKPTGSALARGVKALEASKSLDDLGDSWKKIKGYYESDVPLELEAKYQEMKEHLEQQVE